MVEALPAVFACRIWWAVGEREFMIGKGLVKCRSSDLDHFEPRRALEHTVTNGRRLEHHIQRLHHEGLALIFVHHANPAFAHDDQLKSDAMKVDPVGDWTALRNADV